MSVFSFVSTRGLGGERDTKGGLELLVHVHYTSEIMMVSCWKLTSTCIHTVHNSTVHDSQWDSLKALVCCGGERF